jgi:DHA3 family tetracycline resistance protein-like MFS transporter
MSRNSTVYLLVEAILAGFGGFILPIYVLYFRYYNITLFEVALLAAVFEAAVLISEIPTGLIADRFGRKLSVVLGFACFTISGLMFILFRSLTGFLVAEILFGIAEAFISGAAEALAVDSLPGDDRQGSLRWLYTRRSRIRIAITAVCMIVAGYAYSHDVSVTFYPVLFGGMAGLGVSWFFIETGRKPQKEGDRGFVAPLAMMFRRIKVSAVLKVLFVLALTANFAFEAADQYWQVLLSELFEIDVKYFGYLTAAGAALAFFLVGPIVRRSKGQVSTPMLILLVSGIIISSLPNAPTVIIPYLLILYFVTKEMVAPLFSYTINSIIDSEGRATFLSGFNLTCSIGEVGAGLVVGFIAARLGLPVVFVVGGSVLVLVVIAMLLASRAMFDRGATHG